MISPGTPGSSGVRVWVATAPVDMRKGFDSLAEHVRAFLGHDPLSGNMFVFRNKVGQRVKILWWSRGGLTIFYKRLEKGTFHFPRDDGSGGASLPIDSGALVRLLDGMEDLQPGAPGARR